MNEFIGKLFSGFKREEPELPKKEVEPTMNINSYTKHIESLQEQVRFFERFTREKDELIAQFKDKLYSLSEELKQSKSLNETLKTQIELIKETNG